MWRDERKEEVIKCLHEAKEKVCEEDNSTLNSQSIKPRLRL
jgi:hypothetical protein